MFNQFILTRTLRSREGTSVEWESAVTNNSVNRAFGGLDRAALVPQDVDPSSVEVVSGPVGGRFDLETGRWSFTLDPEEKATLVLRGTTTV